MLSRTASGDDGFEAFVRSITTAGAESFGRRPAGEVSWGRQGCACLATRAWVHHTKLRTRPCIRTSGLGSPRCMRCATTQRWPALPRSLARRETATLQYGTEI